MTFTQCVNSSPFIFDSGKWASASRPSTLSSRLFLCYISYYIRICCVGPPSNSKCNSIFIVCFADHWKEMRFHGVDWIGKKGKENLIDKWEAKWLRSIKSLSFYGCINNVKWNANFPLVRLKWITLNIQLENRVNSQMGNDSRPWKMSHSRHRYTNYRARRDSILFWRNANESDRMYSTGVPPGIERPDKRRETGNSYI